MNHPKNDRMANVTVKPTMCAFISSVMLRILCVPRARQDACSSLSKKQVPLRDDLQRAWLYLFTRAALNTSMSCRLAQSHKIKLLEEKWVTAFDQSAV